MRTRFWQIPVVLMLFSTPVLGQDLHVDPSTFIFVDGDGFDSTIANSAPLFVTNGINLDAADSVIYLRDEAQLLQGNETAFNSGLGAISIYQEGTVNIYAYNYWCSPVGSPTVAASNESFSETLMQQSLDPTNSQGFNFNPPSVYDGNNATNPIQIASRWFYTFVESDEYAEWTVLATANPGIGFTMKGTSPLVGTFDPVADGQRIDFRGKPNTGTIDVPVNPPAAGSPQFTLTGNPFPSSLDAHAIIWDADNINNTVGNTADDLTTGVLHFWDQDPASNSHFTNDYVGGYATYTITQDESLESAVAAVWYDYDSGGNIDLGPLPNPNSKTPERYIAVGQGFMIEGRNDGFFKIKNAHRVYKKESVAGDNSLFYEAPPSEVEIFSDGRSPEDENQSQLTSDGYKIIPEEYKRFRLFVEFNGNYTRELLQNFHDSATPGFDYGMEGKSIRTISSDAYWTQENDPYIIQAHAFDTDLRIPLIIKADEDISVNFRLGDIQHFSEGQPIYLHDKVNSVYINLRDINYDLLLEGGDYNNRFEITFSNQETLDLEEELLKDLKLFQDNVEQQFTIFNPGELQISEFALYDMTGKLVLRYDSLTTQEAYHFPTRNFSDGIYMASVRVNNDRPIHQKIIIKN